MGKICPMNAPAPSSDETGSSIPEICVAGSMVSTSTRISSTRPAILVATSISVASIRPLLLAKPSGNRFAYWLRQT